MRVDDLETGAKHDEVPLSSRNQCNLAVVVDEKRLEKKNRSINESIFFYIHGAHQPIEIVINKVEKNDVAGYVSVPKGSQITSSASGGL